MHSLGVTKEPCAAGSSSTNYSCDEQTNRPLLQPAPSNEARIRMENGRTTKLYFERFLKIELALSRIQLINVGLLVVYVRAPVT